MLEGAIGIREGKSLLVEIQARYNRDEGLRWMEIICMRFDLDSD